jgi:Phytanoyl-CoA dioxygenase (PhyH)
MALDRCDQKNGCLEVVPGSQDWPVLCTIPADTSRTRGGGPCGEWVEIDGTPVIELTGYSPDPRTTE